VKRPILDKEEETVHPIHKPEQLPELLAAAGLPLPQRLLLEGDELPYSEYTRLAACFPKAEVVNGTSLLRQARSVKTDYEIELFRRSGIAHSRAYAQIPEVYTPGMTDLELSIEVERLMRKNGSLGLFRTFGSNMEIYMGSLLAGANAATPSPYDFALGGAGVDVSLPIGANGSPLNEGTCFMVDLGGNFFGYMSDMSRVFSIGKLSARAYAAQQLCMDVQAAVIEQVKPGVTGEALYNTALALVGKSPFASYFMGVDQQAKFIGHGIGLQINELPILAPRMHQPFEPGMVFALEPKIVLPEVGPLGIENSWVVTNDGVERLTPGNEEIVEL
jgi:Xaa-Pro aminopeptidase